MKLLVAGDSMSNKFIRKANEDAVAFDYQKLEALNNYGKPVPIASIYQVLTEDIDALSDLTITYYVIDEHDNYVETDPQHYDFKKKGYNKDGELLSAEDFREYTISQLRYLFAEQADVICDKQEDESYSITIKQYPRDYRTTYVKED